MHYAFIAFNVASADAVGSHTLHIDVSVPNTVTVFCMNANTQYNAGCISYWTVLYKCQISFNIVIFML
jgi:hypothetical protein